ncbi:LysR family transcriptional regulator [Oceanicaulis sp. LC35]|uniref:LysR family transcriptional regulator n=1 Tax=Oceanicaulis sp. LC35 TaxID=3349635 RepID=UPI003F87357F
MKWSALDLDWNQVRAFLATAQEGSFSAASRALGQTQPTLSRQVSALETTLGVTLFERGTRTMSLTEAGEALLAPAKVMLDGALDLSLAAEGRSTSMQGKVTITATSLFAMSYLPPVIEELRNTAPELTLEVIASNTLQDLRRREADIAIRHVRPSDDDLIGKLIGEHTASLYASLAYVARKGAPSTPDDIGSHDFLGFEDIDQALEFYHQIGLKLTRDQVRVFSGYGEVLVALVRQGLGLCILPDGEFCDGLEPVLPDAVRIDFPVWLVTHRELQTNPRIRLVFDALARSLKNQMTEKTVS